MAGQGLTAIRSAIFANGGPEVHVPGMGDVGIVPAYKHLGSMAAHSTGMGLELAVRERSYRSSLTPLRKAV